jgi:hypothetical protein
MHLKTYFELEKIVRAFARGHLRLLILIGGHGLGKSQIVRQALDGPACWLEGSLSVFGLYCQLWEHRNLPVVLDDVDGLYAQREGVRLLKCLTQSEPIKRVSWHTDAPTWQRQGIPQDFQTSSRVAIIANEWKTLNRNVAACKTAATCCSSNPVRWKCTGKRPPGSGTRRSSISSAHDPVPTSGAGRNPGVFREPFLAVAATGHAETSERSRGCAAWAGRSECLFEAGLARE